MLYQSHLYNAWFQHNPVSYGCSPKAMWRSWPLHIHAQASLYWNSHITEANEPSAWNDRLQAHQLICLLTCITSGTMAVSLTGTASITMPTKSQLTAWNNTPDELKTRLSLGKGTLRWFFESQWPVTHQDHCDLKVSENYPNPTCLAPQKCGICRLSSWLIGSLMATTTLHTSSIPPWGMLWFSARRIGTNPATPVITNCFCSYPSQQVWTTLSILLQNPNYKSNCNYPRMSVLRFKASAAMTTIDP